MCTRQSPGHTSPPPPLLICGSRRPRGYSLSPREWKAWHAPDLERAARQRSECRNCWMLMWRRSWDRHNSQPEQTDSGDDRSSTARGCQTSLIVRPEADMPLSGWRIGPAHDREWVGSGHSWVSYLHVIPEEDPVNPCGGGPSGLSAREGTLNLVAKSP